MLRRGRYDRFVDSSPWLLGKLKERDAVFERTFREPVIDFSRDVMKEMRSRESNVALASQQLRSRVSRKITEEI